MQEFSVFIGEYVGQGKLVFWNILRRLDKEATRRKPVLPYAGFILSPLLVI